MTRPAPRGPPRRPAGTRASEPCEASLGAYSARPGRERSISAAWDIDRHGTATGSVAAICAPAAALSSAAPESQEVQVMRKLALLALVAVSALGLTACSSERRCGSHRAETGSTGRPATAPTSPARARPSRSRSRTSRSTRLLHRERVPGHHHRERGRRRPHLHDRPGTEIDVDVDAGETFNREPIAGRPQPGTYDLICTLHLPTMTGQVTIVAVGRVRSRGAAAPSGRAATPSAP